jgi:cell wall-associated NlpC family hydrolase
MHPANLSGVGIMEIRNLVGSKYLDHGRDPAEGLDCYGLAMHAVRILSGKTLPDVFYPDTGIETNKSILQSLEASIPNTETGKPEKGAIVELLVMGQPSHVGVCLGDGTFIHALKKTGVVIEPLARYRNRIKGYYRVND